MTFNTLTVLYNHHLCLIPECFISPKGDPVPIRSHSPPCLPQPLAITNLLPVSVDWPVLDISYQWSHTLCGLFVWLLSLSTMFSRLIHVVARVRASSLSVAE